ncbi:uncharacterized protein P884DRAFT_269869 [Thermothelomyces heterothallicus CBS 202.75]|uniref:uncharacterized protein n=1 Tax=Thermothelomyces heterothallicus CBS 202.75 TaxID=1149848 RepID=UPI0037442701
MGHIRGGSVQPCQSIYFIAGGVTTLWGVALWWLFPDTPQNVRGFSEEERALLLERSFTGFVICFVICFFCAEILRFFLARENKNREARFGPPNDVHDLEDLTDKENKSFRYHL